jgi:Flp pilus assembly pilin Flp
MGAAIGSALSPAAGGHMRSLHRLLRLEDGQDLLEYGVLAALIALVALGGVGLLGEQLNRVFWSSIGASI